ncbi:hypothetical protein EDD70_2013 [Hydrogenoanaerobacterium saccharovorans]|uniref:hypothetical protein n=1 Tax=Hydrogenoanaerobacterium saccharovorans TaxID=474960 RepID=UPI000F9BCC33|nr:hypothetical protein [Hydrogenoanaerobacterium saccharovorans]RPF49173.1 hypothetical protein EDD70_2013 [Hydrogenoanaerobacterium saccharovorans]
MAEPKVTTSNINCSGGNNLFKEAVCIDTKRIYDSCSAKDCLEDLQVYFVPEDQTIVDNCNSIKAKSAEILNVFLDVEPVPFNKGFYSVDITFFFCVKLQVYTASCTAPTVVKGLAIFTKKVILFGSEGNVRVYSSESVTPTEYSSNMPIATVSVVDPIVLSARVCPCHDHCPCHIEVPQDICSRFKGEFSGCRPEKCVYVTIGMFTIVQLERNVQMLIPAYDFCVPDKECVTTTDDPCEVFKAIKFPTSDFFPPREQDCHCKD